MYVWPQTPQLSNEPIQKAVMCCTSGVTNEGTKQNEKKSRSLWNKYLITRSLRSRNKNSPNVTTCGDTRKLFFQSGWCIVYTAARYRIVLLIDALLPSRLRSTAATWRPAASPSGASSRSRRRRILWLSQSPLSGPSTLLPAQKTKKNKQETRRKSSLQVPQTQHNATNAWVAVSRPNDTHRPPQPSLILCGKTNTSIHTGHNHFIALRYKRMNERMNKRTKEEWASE